MIRRIRFATLLFLLYLLSGQMFAQKSLAVRAGMNTNNQLDGMFGTEELQPGILFGVGLINDFGKAFGSGIELSYIERGAVYTRDSVEYTDANQYIELGVSVKLRKQWENSSIYLTGGMLLSFWQSASRKSSEDSEWEYVSHPNARSSLDVGMYLGAGYKWKKLLIEVRTFQGLMDISNDKYDNEALYNQGISFHLAYAIPLDD